MWNFRRLAVWQRSRALAVAIVRLCEEFPRGDRVFSDQMKRAANSVGANIAEGSAKSTGRDRARYLVIALGSLSELEHHLLVASDIGYVDSVRLETMVQEITELRWMTHSLRRLALSEAPDSISDF